MDLTLASYALVERVAPPLGAAAWPVALGLVLGLGWGLRGRLGAHRGTVGAMLGVALLAHLLDFALTLYITPDLALEANPLWRVVVERAGLPFAIAWGGTGKVLVAILHAEAAAWYLVLRERLYPERAEGFGAFVRGFGGSDRVSVGRVLALLAFLAAGFAPFFFYVSVLNAIGGVFEAFTLYEALPGPLVAAGGWGLALGAGFYAVSWQAYRAGRVG